MPDEEFDAQFRQGLEHYPEQPENPAAWHRMDLLLDADLRQQALRRRVLRLLGAEAIILLLGVWATFSLLLEKLPIDGGQPPLATIGRATSSVSSAAGAGRGVAVVASRRGTEKLSLSTPKPLLDKQPAQTEEASQLTNQATTAATKPSIIGKKTLHSQPVISSAAGALVQLEVASHAHKAGSTNGAKQLVSQRSTLLAAAHSHRANHLASNGEHAAPEKNTIITNGLAKTTLKKAAYSGKHRLHQSTESNAQKLVVAAGRKKTLYNTVASSPEKAIHKAPRSLTLSNRHVTTPKTVGNHTVALANTEVVGQPIDLLAPRWPASGLHFQLPDSLALLSLTSTHPADSLNQKPRPLLSAYRFRVGLVGAPEFSTVRADRLVKPGSSLGVTLEYQLGRRWRVSAGYLYTNKLYAARGTDYTLPAGYTMPHGYVISNVDAACRIVDIPFNLRYDLWQRPRYQLFVSAGLSSLLMRREQYTYDYDLVYGKPVAPYSWELDNGSQHVLKVLNLSAGYERAVGLRWTVQAEPFVKLPLAGVGFGAVRLSSAGVFFSLKYGLLPVHPAPAPR